MKASLSLDKKAVSLMVSYVILIVITISLSIMVFAWLKIFVGTDEAIECPAGIHLIVKDYNCSTKELRVTLKNKGRFTVEDFVLRVNDQPDSKFGIYPLDPESKSAISPGKEEEFIFNLTKNPSIGRITLIDIQPIVIQDDKKTFCRTYATQKANCP